MSDFSVTSMYQFAKLNAFGEYKVSVFIIIKTKHYFFSKMCVNGASGYMIALCNASSNYFLLSVFLQCSSIAVNDRMQLFSY